jgi:hypothetical protein
MISLEFTKLKLLFIKLSGIIALYRFRMGIMALVDVTKNSHTSFFLRTKIILLIFFDEKYFFFFSVLKTAEIMALMALMAFNKQKTLYLELFQIQVHTQIHDFILSAQFLFKNVV